MKSYFIDDPSLIYEIRQGIERECLRTNLDGKSSLRPHAAALGSKLAHPSITTDYSENLCEFITKVHSNTQSLLQELEAIHGFTQKQIGEEVLWANSMPSILPEESLIPLAYYGESNIGRLKTLYRKGLGHRYGRSMQSIAGIHYNFSLSDSFWAVLKKSEKDNRSLKEFKSEKYFGLIRNFRRYNWLLVYLFGASPVVDESFLEGKNHELSRLNKTTFFTPTGTSLRMGGLGYTSSSQEQIGLCYNHIDTYIRSLEKARLSTYRDFEKIGLKKDGVYKQLNTHLLQLDNEFYSSIRPKNIAKSRESALKALHERGIEYIEVRLLDVDPFSSLGISSERIHFLHLFLLWCLSKESPLISGKECSEIDANLGEVVTNGRGKNASLSFDGKGVTLRELALKVLTEISDFSKNIQEIEPYYAMALDVQWRKLEDSDNLPSQKLLNSLSGKSFVDYTLTSSSEFSRGYSVSDEDNSLLEKLAIDSLKEQARLEQESVLDFDSFLIKYFDEIKINFNN